MGPKPLGFELLHQWMFSGVERSGTEAVGGYDKQADFLEHAIWC